MIDYRINRLSRNLPRSSSAACGRGHSPRRIRSRISLGRRPRSCGDSVAGVGVDVDVDVGVGTAASEAGGVGVGGVEGVAAVVPGIQSWTVMRNRLKSFFFFFKL